MDNPQNGVYKTRQRLLEDALLKLGTLVTGSGLQVDATIDASTLATETTLKTVADGVAAMLVNQTNNAQITQISDGSGNIIGSTTNALNVNVSSGNITGFATSVKQTDGSQKSQIVDSSGNVVSSTSNALDVNIKSNISTIPTIIGHIQNTDIDVLAELIDATTHPCKYCIVQSASTNTGQLWIGTSTVTAENGILLFPTDNIRLDISNTNVLYAYASVINQSVSVTYFN